MNRVDHLLLLLVEEAVEVGQAATKAIRFGLDNVYPVTNETNLARLVQELNDVAAVVKMLIAESALPRELLNIEVMDAKRDKIERFMAYSVERGKVHL